MQGFEWNRLTVDQRRAHLVEMGHGKNPKIDKLANSEFKTLPDVLQRTLGLAMRAQIRPAPRVR
jgi:hypothetical protein